VLKALQDNEVSELCNKAEFTKTSPMVNLHAADPPKC